MTLPKLLMFGVLLLVGCAIAMSAAIYTITFHPQPVQEQAVTSHIDAPILKAGQQVKILSFNVQYMASKNYVFWYDVPGDSGPDVRPSPEHISWTLGEVARIILDEDPDVVMLQEVNDGDRRTDYEDQLQRLLKLLPNEFHNYCEAFYWKADFVPHEYVLGSVGMKLSTLSKYRISKAVRHQLPQFPKDIISREFYFKRAVLAAYLPVEAAEALVVMNTHLDAWDGGTDLKRQQVNHIAGLARELDNKAIPWILGGDFNLLPPDVPKENLPEYLHDHLKSDPELKVFYDQYGAIPSRANLDSPQYRRWYTHFGNHPELTGPDKTIDFIFYSLLLGHVESYVRQHDTLEISDHLPMVALFRLPEVKLLSSSD